MQPLLAILLTSTYYIMVATMPVGCGNQISVTPHDSYSSKVGVLGCKIDINRVAYWPTAVDCNSLCVRVSANNRSVNLLKVDQSDGAHDISYDAWNYLVTGESATESAVVGGGVTASYEDVEMEECKDLLKTDDRRLAFSAANSMNFINECLNYGKSWVAKNYDLYNIVDSACTLGVDEKCSLDSFNHPQCSHKLGLQVELEGEAIENIAYSTGKSYKASRGL